MIKYILYQFHIVFIFVTMCGWNFYPKTAILMPIVGLSWELNDDQCLLTQMEKYFFNSAILPGRIPKFTKTMLYFDLILFMYFELY
jgi:hypothetical protein